MTIVPSLSLWANLHPLCNVISLCTVDLVGWPLLKKASCWTHSVTSSNYGWNFSCQPWSTKSSKVHDDDHDDMDLQPLWIRRNVATDCAQLARAVMIYIFP